MEKEIEEKIKEIVERYDSLKEDADSPIEFVNIQEKEIKELSSIVEKAYKEGELHAFENALAWTNQQQPENQHALMAHGNAVDQTRYELEKLKQSEGGK